MTCPPPPPYPPGLPPPPPPSTQGILLGGWVPPGEGGKQVRTLPATGLTALGLSDFALNAFTLYLQGVVATGVSTAVPSPALYVPTGKVAKISLLHLRSTCRVAVDGGLPTILEAITW